MSLQVKNILGNMFYPGIFFSPLEWKIMLNKFEKKETSALLMIMITELLSLIIIIKLFSPW